ncbi:hypothetical protein [Calycomorphotria hydatis]|uniref:Zinc finger/thioredoxin putative domain-containing protein n=1 Tax=Calycomorphotria hydatis TaxID=2528027 RepID=A0A517TCY6_9PLAN|nr:hypothetical protein [Calycomorphotria hydatis]QDT66240.1 hypothetical protein V22_35050 [Calycomorphotria hydatis]
MPIRVTCPDCFDKMRVPDKYLGKKIRCRTCHQPIRVEDDFDYQEPVAHKASPRRKTSGRPSSRKKKKPQGPSGIVLACMIGGATLVMLAGVGIFVASSVKKLPAEINEIAQEASDSPTAETFLAKQGFSTAFSESEAIGFGQTLVEQFNSGNTRQVDKLFDMSSCIRKGIDYIPISDTEKRDATSRMVHGSKLTSSLVLKELLADIDKGGELVFRKIVQRDGRSYARVLLKLSSGGFNYLEFEIVKNQGGFLRTIDQYSYVVGEHLSTTVGRLILPIIMNDRRELFNKLTGNTPDVILHHDKLVAFNNARKSDNIQLIYSRYKELPQSLQDEKGVIVNVLSKVNPETGGDIYIELAERYKTLYPNDPSLSMVLLDYYVYKKDYKNLQLQFDKLSTALDGDAYIEAQRAYYLIVEGKTEEALAAAELSRERDPRLVDTQMAVCDALLHNGDFERMVTEMIRFEQEYEWEWSDLTEVERYEEFIKSPHYQTWLDYQKNK